ncbi:RING finger protein nhl-1 [Lingula anatina]|uniref:RING finger protein nhl-1 n=1 Tax=Lingula anatina TaxID=7574 RepID=A0A1S3KEF1_LINAN|nr:RING finger protein nhl-1 [Lingula anatina]|eukprot:XP_013420834.1 RING finger protein nhl-1 [Lingula anatina]
MSDVPYSAEQIDELLKCAICLDRFRNPKLLPCQHTFCESPCLEGLLTAGSRVLKCPECRSEHFLPLSGVRSLPNNRFILSFLDIARNGNQQTRTSSSSCQVCETEAAEALVRCAHCNKQVCGNCQRSHVNQLKHEVGRLVNQMRRGVPKLSDCIGRVEQTTTHIQQRADALKSEVTQVIELQIKALRDRERMLHSEVDTFLQAESRSQRLHQENMEVELASLSSYCDATEDVLNRDNSAVPDLDLVNMKRQCQEYLDQLQEATQEGSVPRRQMRLEVQSQPLHSHIMNLGQLVVSATSTRSANGPSSRHAYGNTNSELSTSNSNTGSRLSQGNQGQVSSGQGQSGQGHSGQASGGSNAAGSRISPRAVDRGSYALYVGSHHLVDGLSPRQNHQLVSRGLETALSRPSATASVNTNNAQRLLNRARNTYSGNDDRPAGMMGGGASSTYSPRQLNNNVIPRDRQRNDISRNTQGAANTFPRTNRSTASNQTASQITRQSPQPVRDSVPNGTVETRIRERTFVLEDASQGTTEADERSPRDGTQARRYRTPVTFDIPLDDSILEILEETEDVNRAAISFRYSTSDSSVIASPRNGYQSKGEMLLKIGQRGTDANRFTWPRGVAIFPDNENIVVADSSNHRLQIFDKRGRFLKTFGSYGQGEGEFDSLAGVCVNSMRQIIVSDRYNHRIQILDRNGHFVKEFGEEGDGDGQLSYPWGVACDDMGFIYVCDKENHRIQVFQLDGTFVRKFGSLGSENGQFENPYYITVSPDNKVIVSDSSNHRVQVFDTYGHHLLTFGSVGVHPGQMKYPRGVAVDDQGFILVADSGNNRIQVFRSNGQSFCSFGSWGSGDGQLKGIEGVAVMADGQVVVSDRENHRLQLF